MKKLCMLLFAVLSFGVMNVIYANSNPPAGDPPVINITGNTTICAGTSTTLTASGAVSYSWKSTNPPPLGSSSDLFAAIGLHKLVNTYAGPVIRIRRVTDGVQADIGFSGNDLDTTALINFLNGAGGEVIRIYDQSGNGHHADGNTFFTMPSIVSNGFNGRPVVRFTSSQFMFSPTVFLTPLTIVMAARQNGPARDRVLSSSDNNIDWFLGWDNGNMDQAYFKGWVSPQGGILANSDPVIYSVNESGNFSNVYKDGSLLYSNAHGVNPPSGLKLGPSSDFDLLDMVMFSSVISNERRLQLEYAIADYYKELSNTNELTVSPTQNTSYTVTGTDANGLTTTQTVMVNVIQPAVISCPADHIEVLAVNNCNAFVNYPAAIATGVQPISISYSQNAGTSFPAGKTTVDVTAVDGNGCSSSCSFNVYLIDVAAPVLNCPQNITAVNNPVVNYSLPTITNSCSSFSEAPGIVFNYTGSPQTFTVPAGITRISIDAYGAGGSGSNATPGKGGRAKGIMAVTPGQVLSLYVGGTNGYNGGGSAAAGRNGGGASDVRTAGASLTDRVIVAGGGAGAGNTGFNGWHCLAGNGNGGGGKKVGNNFVGGGGGQGFAACGSDGGINGGVLVAIYPDDVAGGGGGGMLSGGLGSASPGPATPNGSLGQGGSPLTSCSAGGGGGYYGGGAGRQTNAGCAGVQGGGGSSWTGTLSNPEFEGGVQEGDGKIIISFPFTVIEQTAGLAPGAVFPAGVTTNSFTVINQAGQSAACSFDVNFTDDQDPVIEFPTGNIIVNNDPGQCGAVVNYPMPTVMDNSCTAATTLDNYTYAGTFNSHSYFVSDNRTYWPEAKNQAAAAGPGANLATINSAAENTFLQNATNEEFLWIGLSDFGSPGTFHWVNNEPITYQNWISGAPSSNAYASFSSIYGWWNNFPSNFISQPSIVEVSGCISPVLTAGLTSGSNFPIGTTPVTWTATDGAGNTAQVSFTVTVRDIDAPAISCKDTVVNIPGGQCNTNIVLNNPAVSDCSAFTITNDHPSTIFTAGTTLVTWTATDAAGNHSSCTCRVIVHKASLPVISNCPQNISVNNDPGQCGAVVTFSLPAFTDDCPGTGPDSVLFSYTGSIQSFVVPAGVTNIRMAATGAAGGTGYGLTGYGTFMSGDFTVIPGETLYVLAGGKGDDDSNGYAGGGGGTFIWRDPGFAGDPLLAAGGGGGLGSDASTGINGASGGDSGNWGPGSGGSNGNGGGGQAGGGGGGWFSDGGQHACGNAGKSPRNGGAGGTSCGARGGFGGGGGGLNDIDGGAGAGGGYSGGGGSDFYANGGGGGSFNAGSNQINIVHVGNGNGQVKLYFNNSFPKMQQTAGLPPGTIYPIGTTVNTWTVTDVSGNVTTCSNTVTVTDNEVPVIQCVHDIVVNTDPGQCSAIVNYQPPTATDNCQQAPAIPGYTLLGTFNNHSYYLSNTDHTWTDAKTAAIVVGGTLACVNSATENNFLVSVIPAGQHPWLGGFQNFNSPTFAEPAGGWEWVDGSIFNYTNWISGNPDNYSGTEHVLQWYDNYWNDATETDSKNFVIEISRGTSISLVSGLSSGSAFPIGTTAVTWSATDASGNTVSCTFNVTVNGGIPGTPGNISGPTNICPYINTGGQVVYSISPVQNATGYQWIVPPTVSIVSGQNTNSIIITVGSGFAANANKVIRVKALSSCGSSAEKLIYLLAQSPTTASAIISSLPNICPVIGTSTPVTFTIPRVAGASSYLWTVQAGTTTVSHPNGAGVNDTTIAVIFDNGFTTSNITVQPVNDCGTGAVRSIVVSRSNPAAPSLIGGPTNVCANIGATAVAATYSVAATAGNTYNWVLPAGITGLTGQGSNSISFTYPAGFTSGSISVTATNGCGTGIARTLAVSKLNPATPSVIDVIQTQFCPGRKYSYTLSSMPSNATSVQWAVPATATGFTGQGTTSIIVSYPDVAVQGTITATAINNCGTSSTRSTQVKLPACPPPGFSKGNERTISNDANQSATLLTTDNNTVTVVPNPSTVSFKLTVNSFVQQTVNVILSDASGRKIKSMSMESNQSINFGNDLAAGIYFLQIEQDGKRRTERIIKL